MASTRSWCCAVMISTLEPMAVQNSRTRSTAASSAPSGGVRMHQRLKKRVEKPASGPECSVPATGCAGTKWTPPGRNGSTCATTDFLTEPTSDTMEPGLSPAFMASATAPHAPTGTHRMTRSASLTPVAGSEVVSSAMPSSRTRASVPSSRSTATMVRARLRCLAARAMDEPINPMPIRATRSKSGIARGGPRRSGMGLPVA